MGCTTLTGKLVLPHPNLDYLEIILNLISNLKNVHTNTKEDKRIEPHLREVEVNRINKSR